MNKKSNEQSGCKISNKACISTAYSLMLFSQNGFLECSFYIYNVYHLYADEIYIKKIQTPQMKKKSQI